MDRNVAEFLIERLHALAEHLNNALLVIEQISDEKEKKRFRRALAEVMCDVYFAQLPILKQYPELDPYKELFKEWDERTASGQGSGRNVDETVADPG